MPMENKTKKFIYDIALKYQDDTCLTWPYQKARNGYAKLAIANKKSTPTQFYAHRFICEIIHGAPPIGMVAAHSCNNGHLACVNPKHISWKTQSQNCMDKRGTGRNWAGERCNFSKLTEANVIEILTLYSDESAKVVAEKFGVLPDAIWKLRAGKSWIEVRQKIYTNP